MHWAGLPLAVVGPSILSKGVETGPTVTQFGPACAQTLSPSPREDAAKWAYPLFLPQETFLQFLPLPVSAAGLMFLPQKELFSSFCHRSNFSAVQQDF